MLRENPAGALDFSICVWLRSLARQNNKLTGCAQTGGPVELNGVGLANFARYTYPARGRTACGSTLTFDGAPAGTQSTRCAVRNCPPVKSANTAQLNTLQYVLIQMNLLLRWISPADASPSLLSSRWTAHVKEKDDFPLGKSTRSKERCLLSLELM